MKIIDLKDILIFCEAKMLKKKLKRNEKTQKYLNGLPKIYLIGCWAHWGLREFAFSGKYKRYGNLMIPLVWQYDDHNGATDNYYLKPITVTTSGVIITWTFDKIAAEQIATALEIKDKAHYTIAESTLK